MLFVYFSVTLLESLKANETEIECGDFPKSHLFPGLSLASLFGCVTVCAVFSNKLAFFLSFETTPDYCKCIPLGTKGI